MTSKIDKNKILSNSFFELKTKQKWDQYKYTITYLLTVMSKILSRLS